MNDRRPDTAEGTGKPIGSSRTPLQQVRGIAANLLDNHSPHLQHPSDYPHRDHLLLCQGRVRADREDLWSGDLDVTLAEPLLTALAVSVGAPVFVSEHQPRARPELVRPPIHSSWPDGSHRFDQRVCHRSQDGSLRRRGVRPNRHPPDQLRPGVFQQHQVWVDQQGCEHEIESMPYSYLQAVQAFCLERAERIHQLALLELLCETDELLLIEHDHERAHQQAMRAQQQMHEDPLAWIEQTPLLRALRWQLEAPSQRPDDL